MYQVAHVFIFAHPYKSNVKIIFSWSALAVGGGAEKFLHRSPNPLSAALNEPGQVTVERLKSKSRDLVGGVPCTRSHSDEKSRHGSDVFKFQYVTQQDPCNDWIPAECTIICIQAYTEASGDKRVTHFHSLFGRAEIQSVSCTVNRQKSVCQTVETHTTSEAC